MNQNSRFDWHKRLEKIAAPVLQTGAERNLRAVFPSEKSDREVFAPLAATARVLVSCAPWLELDGLEGEEAAAQARFRELAHGALAAVVHPDSPDFVPVESGAQTLVEAAKLAQALVLAPRALKENLDPATRRHLVAFLQNSRQVRPGWNNWLLFSALVEVGLHALGEKWDVLRVDYALRQHEQWYLGDGFYSDGPRFHCDFYNSLVIHPLLLLVFRGVGRENAAWEALEAPMQKRARRQTQVLERLIAPDGSFAPLGRSLGYRCGVFHLLALSALWRSLPDDVPPAQARCALGAVIERTLDAPGTFDQNGWLSRGLCGFQPSLTEKYLSRASSYLCGFAFLPLGLAPDDEFWSAPALSWTQKRIWNGEDSPADQALD